MEPEIESSSSAQSSLWPLALLGILAIASFFRSKSHAPLRQSIKPIQARDSTDRKRPDSKEKNDISAGAATTIEIPVTRIQNDHTKKRRQKILRLRKAGADLISYGTLLAVIGYAAVARNQWKEMIKATEEATRSAETAAKQLELTSRPWVDIDVSITAPVTYDSNGVHIVFTFVPKNIGQSPAQDVSIALRLIPGSMGTDVRKIQGSVCKNRASAKDEPLRYVLFPNRVYSQQITMGLTDAEINSQWSKFDLGRGPIDLIPVLLVGCVDYAYDASPRHHQTGFAFDVLTKDRGIILKSTIPLAPSSIMLMPHAFGGHFAN